VLRGHTGNLLSFTFSPDGKALASTSDGGPIKVWDVPAGRPTASFPGPTMWPGSVAFALGGKSLLTAGWAKGNSARVLDAATGRETGSVPFEAEAFTSFAASPDGALLAARGPDSGPEEVRLWDVATGRVVGTLPGARAAVAFSPDGKVLAAFGVSEIFGIRTFGIRLWDVGTRRVTQTVPGLDGAFSPDGRAFASSMFWTLLLSDVRTGTVRWSARGDSRIWGVAFSPDGRTVAACEEYAVRVFDAATGRATTVLKGRVRVAFSPDGKWLATGSEDGKDILLWDAKDLNPPK
jgi:WD40 repeat protein